MRVEPSFDRWVDIQLELVAGAKTLAKAPIWHVDAEEGKTVTVKTRLVADAAELEAAAGGAAVLRVTVIVTGNH